MSMYDITAITITVAAIGALVKEYGGIDAVLHFIHKNTKSKKGAQLSIAALVAGVDLSTANNTIAIVLAGPIAKEISLEYDIDPRRTASLLDIFASVAQGLIPTAHRCFMRLQRRALRPTRLFRIPSIRYLWL